MSHMKMLRQKWYPCKDPDTSFEGKTVIVTGASSGLGYETALKFARLGASKLIIAVRSLSKGNASKQSIEAALGKNLDDMIEIWELEMGDYTSISNFAKQVEGLQRVDAVVLNAGVIKTDFHKSKYGYEDTLQINLLSTMLLALLLLPKLKSSKTADSTPVLEIVSSGLYPLASAPIDGPLDFWNKPDGYDYQKQYNASKLLVQCGIQNLAKLTQPVGQEAPNVIVLGTCPGACVSDLARDLLTSLPMRIFASVYFFLFFRSAEQGSRSFVSGVLLGPEANGGFWKEDVLQPDAEVISGLDGDRLKDAVWNDIVEALKKDMPEIVPLASL